MSAPDASRSRMSTPLSAWVPHRALVRRRRNDGPGHGPGELDALISAVTVPAHPRELAGERAALAAFRVAQQTAARRTFVPDRSAKRPTLSVSALVTRSMTAKLAFGIVVLSLGGVGYAAQTGALPATAQDAAHRWLGAVGVPGSDPDQPGISPGTVTTSPDQPTATPSEIPSTPPTADPNGRSLVALCQDYDDGDAAALTAPERRRLGTAAGGADRIEAYCADTLTQDEGQDEDPQGAPTLPTPPMPTPTTPPTSPPTGGPDSGQGQGQGPNGNGNAYGYDESQGGGPPASPPGQVKADEVDIKSDTAEDVVAEIDTEPGQPTTTAPTTTTVPTTTPS